MRKEKCITVNDNNTQDCTITLIALVLLLQEERDGMVKQLEEGKEELVRLRKEVESRSRILARVEASYKDVSSVVKVIIQIKRKKKREMLIDTTVPAMHVGKVNQSFTYKTSQCRNTLTPSI